MPRSSTGRLLRQLQAEAGLARLTGVPAGEVHERFSEISRRRFLAGSMGLGAVSLIPAIGCSSPSPTSSPSDPTAPTLGPDTAASLRVAVVGAGLAGLTCAYRLAQAGVDVSVYEAADRIGGRTRTVRGFFADDRTAESGAEAVNSDPARCERSSPSWA